MLTKNPELLNVTKYCIEGADMLRSIANIWDLALGVAEDNDERSFKAAFHQNTAVGEVYKEFISDESHLGHRHRGGGGAMRSSQNTGIETGGKCSH